jgi:ABC-type Fe3+ transport system substrate-binding protein
VGEQSRAARANRAPTRAAFTIVSVLALAALLSACAAPPAPAARGSTAAAPSAQPKFDALVARAKAAGSHEVTGFFEVRSAAVIRHLEDKWKERFGFPLTIGTVPGHPGRDGPAQVIAGSRANTAIVDILDVATPQGVFPALEEGALLKPDWDALEEGFPLIKRLRDAVPPFATSRGEAMSDYCMLGSQIVWVFLYNTQRVKAEEVKGLMLEDLTKPQWRNRVITDNQFAAIYQYPKAPGWSEERMVAYVKGLKDNGAKAVAGGSFGVVQAVGAGQGDVAVAATISNSLLEKKKGVPIELLPPADGWLTGLTNVGCVPRLTKADPALAQLFAAWYLTDGRDIVDDFEGTGTLLFPDARNSAAEFLRQHGVDFSRVIYPSTQEDLELVTKWRKLAMDTFTGQ